MNLFLFQFFFLWHLPFFRFYRSVTGFTGVCFVTGVQGFNFGQLAQKVGQLACGLLRAFVGFGWHHTVLNLEKGVETCKQNRTKGIPC